MTKLYTDDAELYDIAFGWDVSEEVDWLFERLGRPRTVLEAGCGSGRMLEAFARRGVEIAGFDLSPPMIALARDRLGADADLLEGAVVGMGYTTPPEQRVWPECRLRRRGRARGRRELSRLRRLRRRRPC